MCEVSSRVLWLQSYDRRYLQIDIVIAACDAFAPTPSMAAMLVNHYKLKQEALTYSMGGQPPAGRALLLSAYVQLCS